jgi:hypothetical protein
MLLLITETYKAIFDYHERKPSCIYKFSPEAKKIYEDFADRIVKEMNRQLKDEILIVNNMSKDRKIFVR